MTLADDLPIAPTPTLSYENRYNTAAGERLKPFFDNWLRDQEFLYAVKYLEHYWSGEKPLDILLDLPHPMDLTHKLPMTSSS